MTGPSLRFAVLGDPIAHSMSPAMHAAAYRALGLPHVYDAVRAREEDLPGLVLALRRGAIAGLNVTVPHKGRVLALADAIHPSAALAEAANTLVRTSEGAVTAHNTDTAALAEEIRQLAPERAGAFRGARALVIGTGGAARSAVVALGQGLGVAEIVVRGRAFDDGADPAGSRGVADALRGLVARSGAKARLTVEPLRPGAEDAELDVVVQATSAGMKGASGGEGVAGAVAWERLPARAVALDVVYAPRTTPFLDRAAEAGVRSANGLGMLARQGALAFELWLGVPAPYNAMLTAIV